MFKKSTVGTKHPWPLARDHQPAQAQQITPRQALGRLEQQFDKTGKQWTKKSLLVLKAC